MLSAVLIFAAVSAALELILLLKWCPLNLLKKPSFQLLVHVVVSGLNLWVHFGTVTGTMTAIVAALISFATVPMAVWLKTFRKEMSCRTMPN